MKISLLGPTNMEKFASIIGLSIPEIETKAQHIGKILAEQGHQLVVVFNYSGMLRLVGEAYKQHGGKLEMLYTTNDYDWDTEGYMDHLKEGDTTTEKKSWHDMLLSLVTDVDVVVCAGLSAGVFAELGYMKWNYQDKKGTVKQLIGIKELLRDGVFPPELNSGMQDIITISSVDEFADMIKST